MADYYKALGISPQADEKEIKSAYRKLAKKYHQDAVRDNPELTEKMYGIQAAYEVLGDEEKRKQYDERLKAGPARQNKARQPFSGGSFGNSPFGNHPFGGSPFHSGPFQNGTEKDMPDENKYTEERNPGPDMSQFERFFGFQPGKGMDTYQDKRAGAKKADGPINPDEPHAQPPGQGQASPFPPGSVSVTDRRSVPDNGRCESNRNGCFPHGNTVFSGNRYELWVGTEDAGLLLDKWRLSVRKDQRLERLNQTVRVPFYLHEIERCLRPDIYEVMKRFLETKFWNHELGDYQMIKLTGQSCKSKLFEEALKEYVPGILIQKSEQEQRETGLKMCCLEGALSYFFNSKLGYMKVAKKYQVNALPYEIMAHTHEGKEKILVRSMDRESHIGYISRFMVGEQLDIHLMDSAGQRLKTYYYDRGMEKFERTTQEEIDQAYAGTVIQEETDIIQEGEMKFFVWVSRKRWGFIVLPVLRENELLYKGKETFFDFEDDTWEENFFDGRK